MFDHIRYKIQELVDSERGWMVKGALAVVIVLGAWFVIAQLIAPVTVSVFGGKPLPELKEQGFRFYDPFVKKMFVIPFGPDMAASYLMARDEPRKNRVPSPLSAKRRVGICMERCMQCGEFFVPKAYTEADAKSDSPGAFVCPVAECGKDNASSYAPR